MRIVFSAVALLAMSSPCWAWQSGDLWPGPCASANHKIHFPGFGLLSFAASTEIPVLSDPAIGTVPKEPLRYEVTADPNGAACLVRFIGAGADPRLVADVETVIKQWRFHTDRQNGKTYCLSSKVLVYARRTARGVELAVPGITDKNPLIVPTAAGKKEQDR